MKKLYAYIIKFNDKSDNPSYDVRYYEKEIMIDNSYGYKMYRADSLDILSPIQKCECCGQRK